MQDTTERNTTARLALGVLVIGLLAATFGALETLLVVAALIVIIFLHELGHFLTARWSGMKVTEFFLGFGPTLWSTERDGIRYGVKGIPAGAYVRIVGMNNLDEVPPEDEPYTYRQQSFPKRVLVAGAGSTVHFLLAVLLLLGLFWGFGAGRVDVFEVGRVVEELDDGTPAPAFVAGFQPGDRIVALDGAPVADWEQLVDQLRDSPNQTFTFDVVRGTETLQLTATLAEVENPEGGTGGFLGVGPEFPLQRLGFTEGIGRTFTTFGELTKASVEGLFGFFAPSNLADYGDRLVSGPAETGDEGEEPADDTRFLSPVGFVRVAGQAAETGVAQVLRLLVLINVFVGIFNLVPLLPFDGGHIAVAVYERIRSRRGRRYHADVARLLPLTYGVVLVLVLVGVSALWLDVSSPLANPFDGP